MDIVPFLLVQLTINVDSDEDSNEDHAEEDCEELFEDVEIMAMMGQKVMAPQKIWHLYFMVDMLFSKMCLEIIEQMKQSSILVNVGSQVLLYVFPQ